MRVGYNSATACIGLSGILVTIRAYARPNATYFQCRLPFSFVSEALFAFLLHRRAVEQDKKTRCFGLGKSAMMLGDKWRMPTW